MSTCLRPRFIKIDNKAKMPNFSPMLVKYRDVRPIVNDVIPVPCGKCIECLKNRQAAFVSRALTEAEDKGSFVFVTLTYDEEHLPIAQSLWRVSKFTGETELVDKGEIILSARKIRLRGDRKIFQERDEELHSLFCSIKADDKPRYVDRFIDGFEDDEYSYFSRLTPSVCRSDVRLWLKRSRVRYEREHGFKLSPFSYMLVSEYGPNTCRPHYHLAFFGLNRLEADWLASQWTYGFTKVEYVNRVNDDDKHSNGYQCAARYIGKYMSKGKFDCASVLDCSAEKPRVCQSKGIGQALIQKVRPFMLAFDMYGEYDLDSLFCPALGRCFNDSEIKQLCNEIPKRLYYDIGNDFKLPVPRTIRANVFTHKRLEKVFRRKFFLKRDGSIESREVEEFKTTFEPTAIWRLVTSSIREHFSNYDSAKFLANCPDKSKRTTFEMVRDYNSYDESLSQIAEFASETVYIDFLHQSMF